MNEVQQAIYDAADIIADGDTALGELIRRRLSDPKQKFIRDVTNTLNKIVGAVGSREIQNRVGCWHLATDAKIRMLKELVKNGA